MNEPATFYTFQFSDVDGQKRSDGQRDGVHGQNSSLDRPQSGNHYFQKFSQPVEELAIDRRIFALLLLTVGGLRGGQRPLKRDREVIFRLNPWNAFRRFLALKFWVNNLHEVADDGR